MTPSASLPRPEYPRPQFVRDNWLCLNGEWQFEIDAANSGLARGLREKPVLDDRITVPFCPESTLSGIGHVDFMEAVWYRREIAVPAAWAAFPRLRLHFQACDYDATVWVNGQEVVRHRGGFTPFWAEIGGLTKAGETATVVVRARDRNRTEAQPGGKQSVGFANAGCHYTRTTGIWQTVWLEPLPATAFERPRITPDLAHRRFRLELPLSGDATGLRVEAVLRDAGFADCDIAIVAIGSSLEASTLATINCKDLKVPRVVAKASSAVHGRILSRIGADNVVYPDRDRAYRLAESILHRNPIDFYAIADGYSVAEVAVPPALAGKSLAEGNVRHAYGITVLSVRRVSGDESRPRETIIPTGAEVLRADDRLVVFGSDKDLAPLAD